MSNKIAVIGAGLSGLVTLKELLEAGHDAICFEKRMDIGGVFSEMGTYDSVELTVSNYFMAYSDFMPYEEDIKFWSRAEYKAYLDRYADHFNLRPHISFGVGLDKIRKIKSGLWELNLIDTYNNTRVEQVSKVAICSGQFQKANIPDIPGLDTFRGPVIHSSDYQNASELKAFHGKRVLCFGMGESAADVITEVAEVAKSTTLSLRRHHVFSLKQPGDYPIDVWQSRYWHSISSSNKAKTVRSMWANVGSRSCNIATRRLAEHMVAAPDEPGSVVTKTERIFEALADGMQLDIGGVKEIDGEKVIFNSGREASYDAILLCTGFKFTLPFLEEAYHFDDIRECYLQTYHPKLRDEVVFIGYARPQQGGVPLIAELLARYYALVCSGERELPDNLEELATRDAEKWRKEYYETPHCFGLVNGFRFNEKVAQLIGCRPPVPSFLVSPRKYLVYWKHHIWPSQYRLVGPGARQVALENWLKAPNARKDSKRNLRLKSLSLALKIQRSKIKSKLAVRYKDKWRPLLGK